MAGQRLLDRAVHARNLAQEGAAVVAERVLDLVGHRQLGVAQHARLPELGDAGAQQGFVVGFLRGGAQVVALAHQFGHGALGVQDALALDFGRVRGQHRRDVGVLQCLGDVGGADVGLGQAIKRHRQRAFLQVALGLVHFATAHVVAVFGDVGQVREVAERADHAHRLVARQVFQQPVQRLAGGGVLLEAVADRQLAHALDQTRTPPGLPARGSRRPECGRADGCLPSAGDFSRRRRCCDVPDWPDCAWWWPFGLQRRGRGGGGKRRSALKPRCCGVGNLVTAENGITRFFSRVEQDQGHTPLRCSARAWSALPAMRDNPRMSLNTRLETLPLPCIIATRESRSGALAGRTCPRPAAAPPRRDGQPAGHDDPW